MHHSARFRWNDVARILNVSSRTLRRRRHELGMQVQGREYSELTDGQLDNIVGEVLRSSPFAGIILVQGSLSQHGQLVPRARILSSLRRVDPVTSSLRNARQVQCHISKFIVVGTKYCLYIEQVTIFRAFLKIQYEQLKTAMSGL